MGPTIKSDVLNESAYSDMSTMLKASLLGKSRGISDQHVVRLSWAIIQKPKLLDWRELDWLEVGNPPTFIGLHTIVAFGLVTNLHVKDTGPRDKPFFFITTFTSRCT
jgi:hypothetical protein